MVRVKSSPKRKAHSLASEGTTLDGRRTLPSAVKVDLLLAAEIEEQVALQEQQHAKDSDASFLDRLERKYAQPTQHRRKRRKKKREKKSVTFNLEKEVSIPLPEVTVSRNEEAGSCRIILRPRPQVKHGYSLRTITLPQHISVEVQGGETRQNEVQAFNLSTTLAVEDVLRLLPLPDASSTNIVTAARQGHITLRLSQRECRIVLIQPQARLSLPFMRAILRWPILPPSDSARITARRVYGLVDNVQLAKIRATTTTTTPPLSIPHLVPTLRSYQQAAVQWMLRRERSNGTLRCWECVWIHTQTGAPLFTSPSEHGPFWNIVTGQVVQTRTQAASIQTTATKAATTTLRGGILGEAMGLGKSVEVLACILANPWKPPPTTPLPAQRRLIFSDEDVKEKSKAESQDLGFVEDMADFGDADDDSETDGSTTWNPTTSKIALVTPELRPEEKWLDDDVIGACICGELIRFGEDNGPLVTCRQCDEPMHEKCAFLETSELVQLPPLHYRQHFTNSRLVSRLGNDCPCCVKVRSSGCTLIVAPRAILTQWEREIERHTRKGNGKPLDVVVYNGVKHHATACRESQFLHPRRLAQADIVLMTFDALRADLGHADNPFVDPSEGKQLRARKRYRVVPSPLLGIQWWRVCLDEAQRVESTTAQSAQMALKLKAVNKWCVSGTPIGRGKLEDLHGLLLFLGVEPFAENKSWFQKCFDPNVPGIDERIQFLLRDFFWRSTRADDAVREQMGVPEQEEKKIFLKFSSIEKHFYQRQLQATLNAAGDISERKAKSAKRLNLLADQLHKLRAACCHPQVGSGGIASNRASVVSRVMTMSQILDKFVDDAKLQCEEAQRLVVLHTNAMASVSRLKVEAKQRGVVINESDEELLSKSCELYTDALRIADENAQATLMLGDVDLSGSVGFQSQQESTERCSFRLDWKFTGPEKRKAWARFDFKAASRRIVQVRFRVLDGVPGDITEGTAKDYNWTVCSPDSCELQFMDAHKEFQTAHAFGVNPPDADNWVSVSGFRSNKSKSWRLVFFSNGTMGENDSIDIRDGGSYMGVQVEFDEASIASDPLQRLHCLHNAILSYEALLGCDATTAVKKPNQNSYLSKETIRAKSSEMSKEVESLEGLYLNTAEAIHEQGRRRFEMGLQKRTELEADLLRLNTTAQGSDMKDIWDEGWWDDFLVLCHLHGTDDQKRIVCDHIYQDMDGFLGTGAAMHLRSADVVPFPMFDEINGLRTALQSRMRAIRSSGLGTKASRVADGAGLLIPRGGRFRCSRGGHSSCMGKIQGLSKKPTGKEIAENSHCKVCKADWFQTGPECRHCKIGGELEDLEPDKVTLMILRSLHGLVRGPFGSTLFARVGSSALIDQRASQFFKILEAMKGETVAAWRFWRSHLDLLNDIDELTQCKNAMRLTHDGEDVTKLTEEELNAVVVPYDVNARFHSHAAKQAMALGTLNRTKGTLQYLKNLRLSEQGEQSSSDSSDGKKNNKDTCMICLSEFFENRAVLRCGHSVCNGECLDQLQARSRGQYISCPLCRKPTSPNTIMIASKSSHNDGSQQHRHDIKGSYGTKVTRLVSDILDVAQKGEKCLVFSQWEDMLDICGLALAENGVVYVRASSARKMGACVQHFRRRDVCVMMLNVKNGAEGLTLLEATHVFMVEPLLNPGLDSQAISRVHRIGQKQKTFVWRYLIEDTVETKIDQHREDHQEEQLEDSVVDNKACSIKAGGIDGGFHSEEELLSMLQPSSSLG